MTTTPNMAIYVPVAGQTNYDQAFLAGMLNIDQHDHSGAPNKGVPLSSASLGPASVTKDKLNPNVVSPGEGLAIDGANPNALKADGLLNALYKLNVSGILTRTGAGTVAARTLTGTSGQIVVTNGDGILGNPTFALASIISNATQPRFSAYVSASLTNKTGSNELYTVPFDTVSYNTGLTYNNTTGVITCVTAGDYLFSLQLEFTGLNASITDGEVFLSKNAAGTPVDYQIGRCNFGAIRQGSNLVGVSGAAIVPMIAGDTLQVVLQINQGATTVGISSGADRSQLQARLLF